MKYSGVEWIGEIPENWKLNKIGQLFNLRNEKVSDKDYSPLSVSKGGIVPQMENVAKSDASDDRKLVLKGDFAINSRSDRKMSCGVSPLDGSVSLINIILYPKNDDVIYNKYMNYLLKNYGFAEEFYRWGHGIVADLWTTKWQEMKSIMLPLPSVQKQKATYDFLNQKTEEIDSLIELENQQIEKLKEYKQAVITEAVTKGLDKNAPLKDSGVEWIGKIPEFWKIASTKAIFEIIAGATPDSGDPKNWDGDICWITPADYKTEDVFVNSGRRNLSQMGYDSCSTTLIPVGNIIFSKRAPIGLVAINNKELCTNQGCLSCISRKNVSVKYFYYQMSVYTEYYELFGSGTTFKEISAQKFGAFKLLFPPKNIQDDIAKHLDEKCEEIAKLIAIKQKKIDKLNEYKRAIIYEYVTGKKEVVA